MQEGGLGDLARAARTHTNAEEKLHREILFAHEAGSSLRAIAEAVDLSPESVRTIIAEQKRRRKLDRERYERLASPYTLTVDGAHKAAASRRAIASKWRLLVQDSDR